MNKHIFALYFADLSHSCLTLEQGYSFCIKQDQILYRLSTVLRLSVSDHCIFFDDSVEIFCRIDSFSKKSVICTIDSFRYHKRKGLRVTALLPILKKEDFDSAIYALAAVGVETIQLIITEKTQRSWGRDKDLERAHKIIIAAAEQSKYFSMPLIKPPRPLLEVLGDQNILSTVNIIADPAGAALNEFITTESIFDTATILVGPEGGLTDLEIEHACEVGFKRCALTPTILKAEHAVIIMSGVLRSISYAK